MEKNYNVIGKKTEELIAKAIELGIETEGLDYNDLQKAISERLKKETTATTTAAATTTTAAPVAKAKKAATFVVNGTSYCFSRFTPSAFRYDGESRTQAEWLKDKDAMAAMVADGCVYVEIKN